jgi:hypothetical protein
MAEQLAFEQSLGERRAVQSNKWAAGAVARRVNEPREKFFARPAFAAQQDRRRSGSRFCFPSPSEMNFALLHDQPLPG